MNSNYLKTSFWAKEDQPVYKALKRGMLALSDAEILATFISDNKNVNGLDIAKKILLHANNNLIELSKLSVEELIQFDGIGHSTAVRINAAFELGRRRRRSEIENRTQIKKSQQAFDVVQLELADQTYEKFIIILLNKNNRVIGTRIIGIGGISSVVVDVKKIFKTALVCKASSIILGHNHPSGITTPSEHDISLTEKAVHAGKLMDIPVIDHIIVGDEQYYSFADEGRIL